MARFETVVPYFQREPGHLAAALGSVFAQGIGDVLVHVVDDGSPRPARLDLETLAGADRARVNLIEQANGGATAARNRGLDAVSPDAAFVAFLDSDDRWLPGHLERAGRALGAGGARLFYDAVTTDGTFAEDYARPGDLIAAETARPFGDGPDTLEIARPLELLCGDWFRHLHLSVTVLAAPLARAVRFNPAFPVAEDFEFFYRCARAGGPWQASNLPGAVRGTGDNLWHGIAATDIRYGREKLLSMKVLSALRREPSLDGTARRAAAARVRLYREQFYWSQRDRIRAGRLPALGLAAQFLLHDPALAAFALGRIACRQPS